MAIIIITFPPPDVLLYVSNLARSSALFLSWVGIVRYGRMIWLVVVKVVMHGQLVERGKVCQGSCRPYSALDLIGASHDVCRSSSDW